MFQANNYYRRNRPHNCTYGQPEPRYQNNDASNNQYWCETCDRDFHTEQQLKIHMQQHQTCNIDGCKFVAHPKVITKHIQMQHSSGLFKKIAKLNNSEEIAKWREERKRRYPTKVNIEKKVAEKNEKIQRGEKIGLKPDKKKTYDTKKRCYNSKDYEDHNRRNKRTKRQKPPANSIPQQEIPEKFSLKPFAGIQDLNSSSESEEEIKNDSIEDDDYIDDSEKEQNVKDKSVCGALFNLMNEYLSDEEENTNSIETIISKSTKENKVSIQTSQPCDEDDSGPEEIKTIKEGLDTATNSVPTIVTKKNTRNNHRNKNVMTSAMKKALEIRKIKCKVPSTLLQKLLHKEICHERNMVLQCIRYIVQNNYFKESL